MVIPKNPDVQSTKKRKVTDKSIINESKKKYPCYMEYVSDKKGKCKKDKNCPVMGTCKAYKNR
jgi:hypothetical protein